jgi:hypothetical protein
MVHSITFLKFFTAFPMTGISSDHLSFSICWEGDTGATHFGLNFLLDNLKDSCQRKLFFVFPILEFKLKLIDLESVDSDVVLADVETKQVETRATSNLVTIILLS